MSLVGLVDYSDVCPLLGYYREYFSGSEKILYALVIEIQYEYLSQTILMHGGIGNHWPKHTPTVLAVKHVRHKCL